MKRQFKFFIAAVLAFCAVSCADNSGNNVTALLPENTVLAYEIDLARLEQDANITMAELSDLVPSEFSDVVSVIDINSGEVVMFITQDVYLGTIVNINDVEKYNELVKDYSEKSEIAGYEVSVGVDGLFARKDKQVILIATDDFEADLSEVFRAMVESPKENRIISLEQINNTFAGDNDIAVIMNGAIPKLGLDYSSYGTMVSYINFEMGKLVWDVDMLDKDNIYLDLNDKVSGDLNKFMPSDLLLYICGAIKDGEDMKEILDAEMAKVKEQAALQGVDMYDQEMVDEVIGKMQDYFSYLNGDIVLSVDNALPGARLLFEVKDASVLDKITADIASTTITPVKVNDTQYMISLGVVNMYYGVANNILYFTTTDATPIVNNEAVSPNYTESAFAKSIQGNYGGMILHIDKVLANPMVAMLAGSYIGQIPVLGQLKDLTAVTNTNGTGVLELTMKNSEVNFLDMLVKELN